MKTYKGMVKTLIPTWSTFQRRMAVVFVEAERDVVTRPQMSGSTLSPVMFDSLDLWPGSWPKLFDWSLPEITFLILFLFYREDRGPVYSISCLRGSICFRRRCQQQKATFESTQRHRLSLCISGTTAVIGRTKYDPLIPLELHFCRVWQVFKGNQNNPSWLRSTHESLKMAMSKSFRIYHKLESPYGVLMECRNREETIMFESGAVAVLCKYLYRKWYGSQIQI